MTTSGGNYRCSSRCATEKDEMAEKLEQSLYNESILFFK